MLKQRAFRVLSLGCFLWQGATGALAQPVLPALVQATSVDAAFVAVGAGKPVISGHLRLEFDEISTPGPLQVRVGSDLPGTTALVLLSGAPAQIASASGLPAAAATKPLPATPLSPPAPSKATAGQPVLPPQEVAPGYVKAWPVPAGNRPQFSHRIAHVARSQPFTLLVQAQGRWYMVVRDLKIARPAAAP